MWDHLMIHFFGDHLFRSAGVLAGAGVHTTGDTLILHGTIPIMDIILIPMDTEATGMVTTTATGMVPTGIHTITPTLHFMDKGEWLLPAAAETYTEAPGSLRPV